MINAKGNDVCFITNIDENEVYIFFIQQQVHLPMLFLVLNELTSYVCSRHTEQAPQSEVQNTKRDA